MILHGINFGHVWQASGATNFFGEGHGAGHGWWYHPWLKLFGLNFKGTTFVAKTTTLHAREGNMPLKRDGLTPKEFLPKCIHVNRKTRAAVNAVGLSGPGLGFLLRSGMWQRRKSPFFISLMSLAPTAQIRREEIRTSVSMLREAKRTFRADFGIQVNFSCPNGGIDPKDLIKEVEPCLDIVGALDVPLVAKFGPDLSVEAALEIQRHEALDAISVFNTIPWNKLPDEEKLKYFGSTTSPLEKHLGPNFKGGVSGEPLLQRLQEWIFAARTAGFRKPINAGGGILSSQDARRVVESGADSISLGSIAFLAPTQVQKVIRAVTQYCNNAEELRNRQYHIGMSCGGGTWSTS